MLGDRKNFTPEKVAKDKEDILEFMFVLLKETIAIQLDEFSSIETSNVNIQVNISMT
jgi:hypothetical protein